MYRIRAALQMVGHGPAQSDRMEFVARRLFAVRLAMALVLLSAARSGTAQTVEAVAIGCTYNSETKAAIDGNNRAISRWLAGLSEAGGVLHIDGVLHISQTIQFPERAYKGDSEKRPINCGISGNGATSRIIKHGEGWAVSVNSNYPSNYPDHHVRQFLRDLTVQGGGVAIIGGGKAFSTRGLVVTGVQGRMALFCARYDGGALEFNCHDNAHVGAHFEDSHHVLLDATTRLNGGDGIQFVNCVVSGRIYSESNKGYGLDAVMLKRSSVTIWLEGNRGLSGNGHIQGRRRHSVANLFTGVDQGTANVAWDDDPISREANITLSNPAALAPVGNVVGRNLVPALFRYQPEQVSLNGGDITIHPGAFDGEPSDHYLVFEGDPRLAEIKYDEGDWFEISADVTGDQPTLDWYFKQLEAGSEAPAFRFACNGLDLGLNFYLSPTGVSKMRALTKAKQAGTGIQPFAWLGLGRKTGPDRDLKLSIKNVEVRYLKNSR